jgi:hypothetical protein
MNLKDSRSIFLPSERISLAWFKFSLTKYATKSRNGSTPVPAENAKWTPLDLGCIPFPSGPLIMKFGPKAGILSFETLVDNAPSIL